MLNKYVLKFLFSRKYSYGFYGFYGFYSMPSPSLACPVSLGLKGSLTVGGGGLGMLMG